MLPGMERVLSRRMWYVPEVAVWGTAVWEEIQLAVIEQVGSEESILFGTAEIGDSAQQLLYAELVDHRGNNLPESIEAPLVLLRSHGEHPGYVIGRESDRSVKLARSTDAIGPVTTDLLVIEMGR